MRPHLLTPSRLVTPVALTAVLSLLLSLGWLVAPSPAAAQEDDQEDFADAGVTGDSYESPAYGYTLEWDASVWEVREAATSEDGDDDFLRLNSGLSDLYIEGRDRFDGDIVECLAAAVSLSEDDERVTEVETLLDENGDAIEGNDDQSAFAAFTFILTVNDEPLAITQYSECRVLVEDEAVLQIDLLAPQDEFDSEAALVNDVLGTLSIPGSSGIPVTAPADDEEAEPAETPETDDAEPTEAASEDETPEASDDDESTPTEAAEADEPAPTEAATEDEPSPTEEADDPEPTEEAEEEVDPNDLEGVDDDTYTSPTYDYALEWDADIWSATEATSEDDIDTLVLEDDVTVLTIIGTAEFGENLDRCVRTARRTLEAGDGVEDVTATLDGNGDPIEIDEDDRAGAVYTIFLDDDPDSPPDQVAQIECRVAVPGEALIQIVQITSAADFNAEIEPVRTVLDAITLADDESEETPTPEDEPTPDQGEDEEFESTVDGNSYVSPNFGYSIEWDEDVWEFDPDEDGSEGSEPGFDSIFLSSDNSGLVVIGAEFEDPQECVDNFATFLRTEDDVDNWAPLEDEDGEQIEGETDGGYFAAFTLTAASQGQDFDLVYYFDCRTVVEGESVVLFFMTTSPEAYEDATTELDDLLDTLVLPDGDESSDEDAEPTPTAEDEEAEPTPEDEAQDEDAEPTPTAADEEDQDETPSDADLDSYTDPDFPFTITWDEGIWTVADQRTVDDGHNLLNLTAERSDLTIEGWARWDGVPTDCLNDITTNLRAIDGVEDFERVSDTDLYPDNAAADGAYALYSFTLAPEGRTPVEYYGYVECRTVVEGEAVVVLTLIVPVDEYDALRLDFEPILASIEIDES